MLIGSMALAAQGIIRATRDIDFFVSPDPDNIARLKRALHSVFDDPSIDEITADDLAVEGVTVKVATPRMLYRMKRDTVRPQDRIDAEQLRLTFGLDEGT